MTKKIFRSIFIILSLVLFIFLIRYFYIETKMGFSTEILELNYSALPMYIDAFISVIMIPLLAFPFLNDIYDKVSNFFIEKFSM